MRGFWKLALTELKLYLREPIASFFTLAFPIMLLLLFGGIYGNKPSAFFGGLGFVDTSVPAYTAIIIGTTGLMSLAISVASQREKGVLRRYKATPLSPLAYLGAQVITLYLMTAGGMVLLILTGKIFYHLRFSGNVLNVWAGFTLSCAAFFALGFVLAGIMPTARSAQVAAMILYYPMMFLSGAAIPREVLPAGVHSVAKFLPMTPVVNLLRGLWNGEGWTGHGGDVLFLAGFTVVFSLTAARTFRWE
jgi:ABC-2 type transport system permease protein